MKCNSCDFSTMISRATNSTRLIYTDEEPYVCGYLYYLKDRLARTMQKRQRINFNSISDKYMTCLEFDEFLISFDLIA